MTQRASAAKRGYNSRWQKAREAYLLKHPECVECFRFNPDKPVAATVVDHKVPHRLGEALAGNSPDAVAEARRLFWDQQNWQSLCERCHNSHKQRLEKSGTVAGCDVRGIPLDPNHHWAGGHAGEGESKV